MTWKELKREIKTLGFEEESTMEEYNEIVIDSSNRALQFIFDDVVVKLEAFYKRELKSFDEDGNPVEWKPKRPEKIDEETMENHDIGLPDNLVELVPLLTSYYVWLDDDMTKAVSYYNVYDTEKNNILASCLGNVKATIMTEFASWGW